MIKFGKGDTVKIHVPANTAYNEPESEFVAVVVSDVVRGYSIGVVDVATGGRFSTQPRYVVEVVRSAGELS